MKPDISDSPTHLWAPESVPSWSLPCPSSVSVDLVGGAETWAWVWVEAWSSPPSFSCRENRVGISRATGLRSHVLRTRTMLPEVGFMDVVGWAL